MAGLRLAVMRGSCTWQLWKDGERLWMAACAWLPCVPVMHVHGWEGLWRLAKGCEWLWRVFKRYEGVSSVMKGCEVLWTVVKGCERLRRAAKGWERLQMVMKGCEAVLNVTKGSERLWRVGYEGLWKVVKGSLWVVLCSCRARRRTMAQSLSANYWVRSTTPQRRFLSYSMALFEKKDYKKCVLT